MDDRVLLILGATVVAVIAARIAVRLAIRVAIVIALLAGAIWFAGSPVFRDMPQIQSR